MKYIYTYNINRHRYKEVNVLSLNGIVKIKLMIDFDKFCFSFQASSHSFSHPFFHLLLVSIFNDLYASIWGQLWSTVHNLHETNNPTEMGIEQFKWYMGLILPFIWPSKYSSM